MYSIAITFHEQMFLTDVPDGCSWLRASFPLCLLPSACSHRKRQQHHANYCTFHRIRLFTEAIIRKTS